MNFCVTKYPALLAALACISIASPPPSAVKLPIEVMGAEGAEAAATLYLPAGVGARVGSLWMQIHGLEYADMASVRINRCAWVSLNNGTVAVAEPGKSYGGIGGGFATLKLTLPIPEGVVGDYPNTVRFRFDRTNGIVSGFRVLALNFLTVDGKMLLSPSAFTAEDPNTWAPPLPDAESVSAGRELWRSARLVASSLPKAPAIRASCAACHARDGRDLKYFNFSNASIVARSRFHGLSEWQGRQIASYIRSLPFPNPGRPWNPPYQPGPGPGGAGLSWVLDHDADTLPYLFTPAVSPAVFNPDGDLNARAIPIAFQLPDWNHWLPRVHPLDAWGERFASSAFARLYESPDFANVPIFFDKWIKSRSKFLPHLAAESRQWSSELGETLYSAQLWQLVKSWEIVQQLNLEAQGEVWPNTIPGATAPAEVNIPDGPAGMGGSGLTNEYFSNAWYELQLLLNDGNHRHHGRAPVDWIYVIGHVLDLQRLGGQPEASRLLIAIIKAMQSTDPQTGPHNFAEGWRPEQNVDPRIMIDGAWAPVFQALPHDMKRTITESLLEAWLDKTTRYPPASYFRLGLPAGAYRVPTGIRNISGGKVWEAAPQFQAAGVRTELVERLQDWGRAYTSTAELFHY